MKKRTKSYEQSLSESLKDPREAAAYLNAHLDQDQDESLFLLALRDVVRAHGVANLAESTSLGRESLYKALSKSGNPKLSTLLSLLNSIGLRLTVETRKKKTV
jgi:probable addiction module antidote protein